ncbi:MAG: hypothetical protein K2G45_05165 [Lachnospiraceae bacterium]|nr:hypothetical protein [Lachnospiraceae bacterium]
MKIRMSIEQSDDEKIIKKVMEKYHFDKEAENELKAVYKKMLLCMSPYAIYKMNQRDTGVKFVDDRQSAIVAMTLGCGVDSLEERLTNEGKLDEAYMLECIAGEMLLNMYKDFNRSYARFHRRYVERYVFIGDEIPVTVIPRLLEEIKGSKPGITTGTVTDAEASEELSVLDEDEIGLKTAVDADEITTNEYGVLSPSKSVIFYAILTENPNQVCEGICNSCQNDRCDNRIKDRHLQLEHCMLYCRKKD